MTAPIYGFGDPTSDRRPASPLSWREGDPLLKDIDGTPSVEQGGKKDEKNDLAPPQGQVDDRGRSFEKTKPPFGRRHKSFRRPSRKTPKKTPRRERRVENGVRVCVAGKMEEPGS